ncbi:uncharacterized protein LOC125190006 [Salvia hispanica]|uniref:uncharacterized protein LOC125190006 n=1 Tax=Salvia hispanica TaxID=49212 RepID=UPI002009D824|nr:uncharacterized protein LOC125190006 [Salvia hispanica]
MATKARFESLELTMNELQQSVQMMCQNMEEMRSILSVPRNENKKETRGNHRNPFAATKEDYEEDEDEEDEAFDSDSSQDSSQKDRRWRNPIRMDFPKYNGSEDPRVWLDRARQYFRAQETPTKKKVQWASYHLDGEANQWWQWFDSRHNRITWTRFEKGLLQRFGTSELEEADEAIIRLKQTGNFRSYLSEFERLVNCVPHWRDKALLGAFMAGLRDDLAKEIRFFRPQSLEHAIELARHADDQAKNKRTVSFHKIQPKATTTPSTSGSMSRPLTSTKPPQARRLTWAEMQAKREKNECFNCDEPFSRGHTCKFNQALLIEIEDEEEEDTPPIYDEELGAGTPAISLNALMGESRGKSMRMTGNLNGEILQLLIDSGSSLNFIHPRRAEELQLPVTHIPQVFVRVANGERMPCSLRFEAVPITIQGITFQTDLYGLSICNLDVVLGLPWLENLGPVLTDYKAMTMEFEWRGSKQKLQGNAPPATMSVAKWADLAEGTNYGTTVFVLMKSTTTEATSKETPPEVQNLIERFADIMKEPKGLPPSRASDHKIALKDERTVINVAPYRYARYQKDEIERQVKDMLETGLIRPSLSPFSSPALLVKKKDGSWRFCVDHRALNDATVKDRFPIPTIDDMLDELHGAKYFSKMDLRAGFHQIRMDATDVSKTAFRVHNGHYEYMVMPFGLCNAPSTFQAAMNNLFRKYLRKFVLVFFDDILVYSKDWKDHLQHLEIVFCILREHQFHLKYSKCVFGQTELEYLGHYISEQGVRVDNRKIETMLTWPVPRNITHLRGFLGLTGYYRRFVRNYGKIASPLTKLLRKGSFVWGLEAEEAFKKLKEAMTTTPVLALPNFDEEFIVETDACGYGIGAVLMQGKRPIAYLSKGLSEKQRMRSTYEKEMLAILEAVRVWRPYLLGRHFKIITDQRSLRYLLEPTITGKGVVYGGR